MNTIRFTPLDEQGQPAGPATTMEGSFDTTQDITQTGDEPVPTLTWPTVNITFDIDVTKWRREFARIIPIILTRKQHRKFLKAYKQSMFRRPRPGPPSSPYAHGYQKRVRARQKRRNRR